VSVLEEEMVFLWDDERRLLNHLVWPIIKLTENTVVAVNDLGVLCTCCVFQGIHDLPLDSIQISFVLRIGKIQNHYYFFLTIRDVMRSALNPLLDPVWYKLSRLKSRDSSLLFILFTFLHSNLKSVTRGVFLSVI